MTKVFIGGSRHVTRLNDAVRKRLDSIIEKGFPILIGDANGADREVQSYLHSRHYHHVEVFCSDGDCRNNVGNWDIRRILAGTRDRNVQFYSAKDRVMAEEATVGLMIWDGKSVGTLLNMFRLLSRQKKTVVYTVPEKKYREFKSSAEWDDFVASCNSALRRKIEQRLALEPLPKDLPLGKIRMPGANALYFGDNLDVLRESVKDGSVDLVYLDPPFNSNATYNVLFETPKGHQSDAQIEAFDDTWHWGEHAEAAFAELMQQGNTDVAEVIRALRSVLGENDMMAYLAMMAIRLVELHRVLKPTGSLYLHCDPTASHYLKIVLDQVFGVDNYRNEIIWKRTTTHSDSKTWSKVADTLLFYTRGRDFTWNTPRDAHSHEYLEAKYRHEDGDGRRYRLDNMTSPNPRPNMMYEWRGFPYPEKGWRYSKETMGQLDADARIWYPRRADGSLDTSKRPQLKRYLDEMDGGVMGTVWTDISPINSQAQERLGYPTQKPLALLERIIAASSNEGDVVLDPFCGCGTAVHAAEKLKRKWIGIDITHLAISLIEKRMRDAFPSIEFEVHGTPKDLGGARNLAERDKYQFQWWACSLVNAQPYQGKKKGADSGIDGLIYFPHTDKETGKIVVSVKGGENVSVAMIRDFAHVIDREKAAMGFFVTLAIATKPMVTEAAGAGFYTFPLTGGKFPKLQILTIEGLLGGSEQARYPHLDGGGLTFKKPKREEKTIEQKALF